MITIEMIEEGIRQGIIRIEDTSTLPLSAVEIGTPICRIGEYWFYFAGQEGEECLGATNFLLNSKRDDIVRQIYDALSGFSSNDGELYDEYCYYEWYLKERLKNHCE